MDEFLTRIIHLGVGRNEQTQMLPDLQSRENVLRPEQPSTAFDAFALFRQQFAQPCSDLRE